MSKASQAQAVVFELFQDLGGFNIDDYASLSDTASGLGALEKFLKVVVEADGRRFEPDGTGGWRVTDAEGKSELAHLVADRDKAVANESLSLLGLDHPMMESYLGRYASLPAELIGISTKAVDGRQGVLSLWRVISTDEKHRQKSLIVPLAIDADHMRCPSMERVLDRFFESEPASPNQDRTMAESALSDAIEPMLHRELVHRGVAKPGQTYESSLIGWIECV